MRSAPTQLRPALLGLALGAALAVTPAPQAPAQISILGLKNSLVQFALEQISVPGSFEITAERVAEPEDGATELQGLAIADADGVWFRAEAVSLSWSPARILTGALVIRRLAARNVEVLRAPLPAPDASDETEEESSDEPFSWPRAPLTTRVDELRLDNVRIAEGVFAGQSLSFDATGSAQDEGNVQSLRLDVTRTDAVEGRIDLSYARDFAADTLKFDLDAREAPGGLVAEFAGLPESAASSLTVDADGPLSGWAMTLDMQAERMLSVAGRATLDVEAPVGGEAKLTITPGEALSPPRARRCRPRRLSTWR